MGCDFRFKVLATDMMIMVMKAASRALNLPVYQALQFRIKRPIMLFPVFDRLMLREAYDSYSFSVATKALDRLGSRESQGPGSV